MNNVLITAPNIEQEKYWKIKCEKEKHYYHPIKLEDHGLSWKVAYIEKYIERKVEELLEYGEESRRELLETLKVINPWVFNLFIKINAPELRLSEICFYLSNVINLRVKCAEGKNTELLAETYLLLANVEQARGRVEQARARARQALAAYRGLPRPDEPTIAEIETWLEELGAG